jgi:hypothetical protein
VHVTTQVEHNLQVTPKAAVSVYISPSPPNPPQSCITSTKAGTPRKTRITPKEPTSPQRCSAPSSNPPCPPLKSLTPSLKAPAPPPKSATPTPNPQDPRLRTPLIPALATFHSPPPTKKRAIRKRKDPVISEDVIIFYEAKKRHTSEVVQG